MEFLNDLVDEVYTGKNGNGRAGRVKFNDYLLAAVREDAVQSMGWDTEYSRKDILKINVRFRAEKLGIDLDGELGVSDVEIIKEEVRKGAKQLIGCLSNAQDNGGFNYWSERQTSDVDVKVDLSRKSEDIYTFIATVVESSESESESDEN